MSFFVLCYREADFSLRPPLCRAFCYCFSATVQRFALLTVHCTLLSSLLLPALDRRRPSYSLSFLVRASDFFIFMFVLYVIYF